MGSTGMHREAGLTTRQVMEAELPNTLTRDGKILASAMVGNVFYAAVEQQEGQPDAGKVWALVVLTYRSSGYFNFTYKEMDETDGPHEAVCPDKILDLLSPIPGCQHEQTYCKICCAEVSDETGVWMRFATEREDDRVTGPRCAYFMENERLADGGAPFHVPGGHGWCRLEAARKFRAASRAYNARVRASKSVERGDRVIFPAAFNFSGGYRSDTFTYLIKDTFLMFDAHRVRIPGWRGMRTTVIKATA
jgi:hypothetical protein